MVSECVKHPTPLNTLSCTRLHFRGRPHRKPHWESISCALFPALPRGLHWPWALQPAPPHLFLILSPLRPRQQRRPRRPGRIAITWCTSSQNPPTRSPCFASGQTAGVLIIG